MLLVNISTQFPRVDISPPSKALLHASCLSSASTSTVLTDIVVSNTSTDQQYVTITVDGINLVPTVPVSANAVINFQFKTVLATTKIIAGYASSASVKLHLSGVEIS
mgnify:CR=1 FL=1